MDKDKLPTWETSDDVPTRDRDQEFVASTAGKKLICH